MQPGKQRTHFGKSAVFAICWLSGVGELPG